MPAFGDEWYPRNMYNIKSREYKHHVETWGDPNKFGYPDFVPMFKAEKFDADAWAELFEQAGARFAGPVAEHHDGFAMWDSDLTPWNAVDRGPQRDITGELEKAIRKRGMRFVTTFHHERNSLWEKPGRNGRSPGAGTTISSSSTSPPCWRTPSGRSCTATCLVRQFLAMWLGKLKEVIDKYHPDLMWFDSWLDEIPESVRQEYLAYYYNQRRRAGQGGGGHPQAERPAADVQRPRHREGPLRQDHGELLPDRRHDQHGQLVLHAGPADQVRRRSCCTA